MALCCFSRIYLGNEEAASNLSLLEKTKITHILSIGVGKAKYPEKFYYMIFPDFDDVPQTNGTQTNQQIKKKIVVFIANKAFFDLWKPNPKTSLENFCERS